MSVFFSRDHEHFLERMASYLIFNILWTLALWVLAIGKLVESGLGDYISHFTNWSWTMSAIFFTAETASKLFMCSERNFLALYAVGVLFWLANGMAWLVFCLVFVMFGDNPNVLTDLTTEHGGDLTMGFALNMNAVFHYLPVVVMIFYVVLQQRLIGWTLSELFYRKCFEKNPFFSWSYLLYILFGPLFALGIYYSCFDIEKVYKIVTPVGILILIALFVGFVCNGITLTVLRRRYVKN